MSAPLETGPDAAIPPGSVSLLPLYLANAVCMMGMMGFVAVAGPLAVAIGLEAWQIGLTATAGGLGWVLSARIWGRAADRIGRRPVLLFGVAAFALFYVALCVIAQAGVTGTIAPVVAFGLLVATRFSMGLTFSALPAAGTALIADRFAPNERAGAMGRLGAAQAMGLLFGPAFVAIAAGQSPALPLFLLALLPFPALVWLAVRLPRDTSRSSEHVPPLALSDRRLLRPVAAAVSALIAVGIAQIVVGFVALDRLGLPGQQAVRFAGTALAVVGIALVVAQMTIAKLGWSPARLMRLGGALGAIGLGLASFAPSGALVIAAYAIAGLGAGWIFPAISAAAANAVRSDEQGRAVGSVSAAIGVGAMLGPIIGGALYGASPVLPFLVAMLAMVCIALLTLGYTDRQASDDDRDAT